MTAGPTSSSSVCLQLGSATTIKSDATLLTAQTSADMVVVQAGLTPSSINKLNVIVNASELADVYQPMDLATFVPYLDGSSAVVSVQVLMDEKVSTTTVVDLHPVHTSFLLAGLSGVSEQRQADGSRVLTASRQDMRGSAGAVAVPLPNKKTTTNNAVTLQLTDDVNMNDDDDDDDDGMIDEDDLLNTDLLAPPPAMSVIAAAGGTDDCAGRKPCDDCTCGRADQENGSSSNSDQQQKNAPSSSCGKCHLGDAFRCASCPYLGKPAFKPGEEHLVLQMTDDL